MPLGLYLSVPFCRTKCTYCNFASDVFSRAKFQHYVDRLCGDLHTTTGVAQEMRGRLEHDVDSVYLGGGTPTILDSQQLQHIFVTIRQNFRLLPEAEITVECAPGTLTPPLLETLLRCGVNRISLGVQSFVDQEAASVGRLHKRTTVLDDIARLRAAGISNLNIDLIAGLPHQTAESWEYSLAETIATGAPHVSVYLLEVDDESRLGRELIAGGTKYHAHFVPDEDLTADLYLAASERLEAAGISQYEISNFARSARSARDINGDGDAFIVGRCCQSRHNLKYWTRQPYLGFGVDAHSMLPSSNPEWNAVRFSTRDSLEAYLADTRLQPAPVSRRAALEESFFLGLRLTKGIDLGELRTQFGEDAVNQHCSTITDAIADGLLMHEGSSIRLTPRGRLLSNEVFARFLTSEEPQLP